jgi:bifunctional non-homologous end joining protein LigD
MLARSGRLPTVGDWAFVDGELVALDEEGKPNFLLVCERILMRRRSIPLTFMVFDVLRLDGRDVTAQPYRERRRTLEELDLHGPQWRTPDVFDDGEALWDAVCEHELEGIVAKRRSGRYAAGELGGMKSSGSRRSTRDARACSSEQS